MALLATISSATEHLPTNTSTLLLTLLLVSLLSLTIYRTYLHPLSHIPGPLICRLTPLWTLYHSYIGDECTQIHALHATYGPILRIAPNELSISDGAALNPIYAASGGFLKAPCYTNFDIEGHSTIFSTLDPTHRALRSKAVVPLFSTASLRAGSAKIEECIAQIMQRFWAEAAASREAFRATGCAKPVNVLNLGRSLAVDAVSAFLFGRSFGGVGEEKLSAAAYVDTLVAVGRFFFLPNWVFLAIEGVREKWFPGEGEGESAGKVDGFVEPLVRESAGDDETYQGRLLKAGISPHEVEVQCKDLLFAGTDSTGTNFSTLCWHLAKQPEIYQKLRAEIAAADTQDPPPNPQTLPYLSAVIREGLRVSMANPTRLPRIVPPGGLTFHAPSNNRTYHLPGGTQVGIQIYSLHYNPSVFPNPFAFKPERWLQATPEMQRDWVPFGLGPRQCIARNLATMELFLGVRALAREGVLEGARAVGERIEMMEWFNSKIKGEKIELVWQ